MTSDLPFSVPGSCALYSEDCLSVLGRLPTGSVDVVVTSPPYNIGVTYGAYDDSCLDRPSYLAWTGEWVRAVKRVLSPSGSLFLNMGGKPTDPWGPFEVAVALREILHLQNVIHWVKSISVDGVGAFGHYKPINSPRYLNDCHEYLFHFTPGGDTRLDRLAVGVPYKDPSNVSRWGSASSGVRCRGNVWFIPYRTIKSRKDDRPHPATFPEELARRALLLHGVGPGSVVMDPFMGLGTTGLAALGLGCSFVGCEIDPVYFELASSALRDARKDDDHDCCLSPSDRW